MKKTKKKPAKYTVTKFCPNCGMKTSFSLFNRESKKYRCNICGKII